MLSQDERPVDQEIGGPLPKLEQRRLSAEGQAGAGATAQA